MENILKLAAQKADSAEVVVMRDKETPVFFERGEINKISKKDTTGVALRLIKDGRLGFATSTTLDDSRLVERALATAQFGERIEIDFPNREISEVESYDAYLASLTEEELIDDAHSIMDRMAAFDPSILVDLYINQTEKEIEIGNSSGFRGKYNKTNLGIMLSTRSAQGFREGGSGYSSSRYFTFPEMWLAQLAERHHQAQKRQSVPTKKMPVIFSPGTFGTLVTRLLAGIDGTNLNAGTSPLEGKIGKKLFDDKLSILEDPHRTWGIFSCPFDDEGVPTNPKEIIKDGVLQSYLYDLKSAREAGCESTGNGFKRGFWSSGAGDKPTPTPTNIVIPGGAVPLADIIGKLDEGILIEGVMGAHTGNINAGEFSLNINPGFYIKDGKISGRATDAMASGNIYETLTNIEAMSSEQGLLAMFGPIGYGPYVLLPEVSVTGKGQ